MATRTNWKELYQDLPENIASLLRDARVKPEQLKLKSDGDILSIKGISESDLETIKAKYGSAIVSDVSKSANKKSAKSADSAETPTPADAADRPEAVPTQPKKNLNSPFYTYPRQVSGRSARYLSMAKKLKKIEQQPIEEAIKTIQSLSKRPGSLDLHLNVESTGLRGEAKLPFSTGKTIRVEIFSDKTITALNDGRMDYDVLLAAPSDMAKLAKFAKILGPKGLMPSPKNGTISPDPEARAKQLMAGSTLSFKTEPKAPIIHTTVGKTSQKIEELNANVIALIKEIGVSKINSAFVTGTQTPSVKLDLSDLK